jgi:hypothetical protein
MRPASPRLPVTARVFTQRFSSTPRGARLARHLAVHRLDAWGVPYGSAVSDTAALLVAELAANAVTHGRVPGRDIEVLLRLDAYTLRIEVSDSRGGAPTARARRSGRGVGGRGRAGTAARGRAGRPVGRVRPCTRRQDGPRRTGPACTVGMRRRGPATQGHHRPPGPEDRRRPARQGPGDLPDPQPAGGAEVPPQRPERGLLYGEVRAWPSAGVRPSSRSPRGRSGREPSASGCAW